MQGDGYLEKALPGEAIFVLLGRDLSAPAAIWEWVRDRVARGLNSADDPQIREALQCAEQMILQRRSIRERLG